MTEGADQTADRRRRVDILVGARLRDARRRIGWSQNQMAEKLALSSATYRDLEEGRQRLSAADLLMSAELTGVGTAWFFMDLHAKASTPSSTQADSSRSAEVIQIERPRKKR